MFSRIYITEYPIQHEIRTSSAVHFKNRFVCTKAKLLESSSNRIALRNSDRNNQVLKLLSAPSHGITISTKQTLLWETRIAKKNVIPMFRLDNIDWLEDTLNDKKTSHELQLSVFQPRINEKCEPIVLDLENTQNFTLIDNPFDQL